MEQVFEQLRPVLLAIAILVVTIIIAWLFRRIINKMIIQNARVMRSDPTNYKFIQHLFSALIYIFGFTMAIFTVPELRDLATSLLAGAGILAVAIGFASQHALSNIISGVFIILFKPFRVNDRLEVKQLTGVVEDITLRHTVIRDFENRRILIPNTVISDEVIINSNFGENRICKWIEFSVSFHTDLDLAKKIIREEIEKHPLHIDPRDAAAKAKGDAKVPVRVLRITDFGIRLRGWAWASSAPDGFLMECDLNESIIRRFEQEGIRMALPHQRLEFSGKTVPVVTNSEWPGISEPKQKTPRQ